MKYGYTTLKIDIFHKLKRDEKVKTLKTLLLFLFCALLTTTALATERPACTTENFFGITETLNDVTATFSYITPIFNDSAWKYAGSVVIASDGKNPEALQGIAKNIAVRSANFSAKNCPDFEFRVENFAVNVRGPEYTRPVRNWERVTGKTAYSIWYRERK